MLLPNITIPEWCGDGSPEAVWLGRLESRLVTLDEDITLYLYLVEVEQRTGYQDVVAQTLTEYRLLEAVFTAVCHEA